ncbi:unnamed protein product [Sympodiomycopsis kandeliae]
MSNMFAPRSKAANKGGKEAAAAKAAAQAANRPWVEKYRPKTIDDVAAQEHTISVLRKTLLSSNLPHMLFYGPPGTGKTSTILALARQLFGPELIKSRVLELNASDERGISVVRDKIKSFAKLAVSNADVDFPCPPFKIIILDEADSMTQDAQSALRRIMEQYSRITRFCLVCNYVTRIIEPLASRCSKFRFRTLDSSSTKDRLDMIATSEGLTFADDSVLDTLITTSDGDLRRAITYLQSSAKLHQTPTEEKSSSAITSSSIVEIAGVVPTSVLTELSTCIGLQPIHSDDVEMSGPTNFETIHKTVKNIIKRGYSANQLLSQFHDYLIVDHPHLSAKQKVKCAIALGEIDKNLIDGADEELQFLNLVVKIWKAIQ